jgi:RNA polymerase sigma-70 factor, ECF subfamily
MSEPDQNFIQLFDRHRHELRLHCYRMLGSSLDTEDMLQETVARAWRAKDQVRDAASARAWLYRIATNVCLDELRRRKRRCLPQEAGPAAQHVDLSTAVADVESWLQPCPDLWLEGAAPDPAARYEQRECIALAFVAALHKLSPSQRATLLLRDVVGLSAEETAHALELSVEAVNSALFRARSAVEHKIARNEPGAFAANAADVETLLTRYLRAWNELDIETFVALLHEDVATSMPPYAMWIAGRAANIAFYTPMFEAQRKSSFLAVPTAANGQAAFAFYRATNVDEAFALRAIQLVNVEAHQIRHIDHFVLPELGRVFRLPESLALPFGRVEVRPCIELAAAALNTKTQG